MKKHEESLGFAENMIALISDQDYADKIANRMFQIGVKLLASQQYQLSSRWFQFVKFKSMQSMI